MKKFFSLIAVLLCSMAAMAQVEITASLDKSSKELSINMKNDVAVQGIGFKIFLPEGVTIAEDDGDLMIVKNDTRCSGKESNWPVDVLPSGEGFLVNFYSKKSPIAVGEGEILNITLEGELTGVIDFKEVSTSDPDGKMIEKAPYDFQFNLETGTGVESIKADAAVLENAAIYNMAGQRVSKAYKGVVISNGKKYMNK